MKAFMIYLGVFPIQDKFVSGGERHFLEVCRSWASRGHKMCALTTYAGVDNLKANDVSVEVQVLNVPYEDILCRTSLGISIFYVMRIVKACTLLIRWKNDWDYEVICSTSHLLYDLIPAILFSKRTGTPLVVYAHGPLSPPPLAKAAYHQLLPSFLWWISEQISLKLIKYAKLIFAPFVVRNELISIGINEERLKILNNAVDLTYIQQVKTADNQFDCCFLGRISPIKGIFELTDIWKRVCTEFPDAKLVIVGGGEKRYEQMLIADIKGCDIKQNIVYMGSVDEEKKYALLKSSKIFVYPSYEDSWGITVCEAMACRLPVVAYDVTVFKHVFKHGILLVPRGFKEQMADEIIGLLRMPHLRERLSKEAFCQSKHYDWESVAEEELASVMQVRCVCQ